MSESVTKQLYRCSECGQAVHLEQWHGSGLVLTCGCDVTQSVKTNTVLPDRWSK